MFAPCATLLWESQQHEKAVEDRRRGYSCPCPERGNRRAGEGPASLLRCATAGMSRLAKLPGQLNPMGAACP
jgi:hypothetical protein